LHARERLNFNGIGQPSEYIAGLAVLLFGYYFFGALLLVSILDHLSIPTSSRWYEPVGTALGVVALAGPAGVVWALTIWWRKHAQRVARALAFPSLAGKNLFFIRVAGDEASIALIGSQFAGWLFWQTLGRIERISALLANWVREKPGMFSWRLRSVAYTIFVSCVFLGICSIVGILRHFLWADPLRTLITTTATFLVLGQVNQIILPFFFSLLLSIPLLIVLPIISLSYLTCGLDVAPCWVHLEVVAEVVPLGRWELSVISAQPNISTSNGEAPELAVPYERLSMFHLLHQTYRNPTAIQEVAAWCNRSITAWRSTQMHVT
jgi:hypothetical protein